MALRRALLMLTPLLVLMAVPKPVAAADLAVPLMLTQAPTNQEGKAEANRLLQLGIQQFKTSRFEAALQTWQQALKLYQGIKERQGEGRALSGLGIAYDSLGNYAKAIEYAEQSLAIAREIKDREGEGQVLGNIGSTLAKQQQPELAIVFYKQSVNVREGIRQDNRTLDRKLQESYTQSVAYTYRQLADLLIAQGRIREAQQVLERLKL